VYTKSCRLLLAAALLVAGTLAAPAGPPTSTASAAPGRVMSLTVETGSVVLTGLSSPLADHDAVPRAVLDIDTRTTLNALPSAGPPVTVEAEPDKIPVLIVHGTFSNTEEVQPLKDNLEAQGLTVYSYNYGHAFSLVGLLLPDAGGIQDMNLSVEDLADEIARVKADTGSDQIDLVGHSQGGLLIKDYLATHDDDSVRKVVVLGASNHGTTFAGGTETFLNAYAPDWVDPLNSIFGKSTLQYLGSGTMLFDVIDLFPAPLRPAVRSVADGGIDVVFGVAPAQQLVGSEFIDALDQTPDTKPGVDYLVLATRDDDWVTPYQSTYLKAVPGARVRNVEVHSLPGVDPDEVILHDDLLTNSAIAKAVGDFLLAPDTVSDTASDAAGLPRMSDTASDAMSDAMSDNMSNAISDADAATARTGDSPDRRAPRHRHTRAPRDAASTGGASAE